MATPNGIFEWNMTSLASSMHLTEDDVRTYFTDGRRVSFMLERRIAYEVLDGSLAASEGAGWDVKDAQGQKWEVRSISKGGIYFCPSYMVGSGRSFNEPGFLEKLDEIEGYIVSDIQSFPKIPYWILPGEAVKRWWNNRRLGTTTKISRVVALQMIEAL